MVMDYYIGNRTEGWCYQCGNEIISMKDFSLGGTNMCIRCKLRATRLDLLTLTLNRHYGIDEVWPDSYLLSILDLCGLSTVSKHTTIKEHDIRCPKDISGTTNTGFAEKDLMPFYEITTKEMILAAAIS